MKEHLKLKQTQNKNNAFSFICQRTRPDFSSAGAQPAQQEVALVSVVVFVALHWDQAAV